ncbi:MAG: YkvA family protein [Terriglobales bacterium]
MKRIEAWRQRVRQINEELYALYLAYRDPRVPWYAKAFTACVVGYAFSPIDLIPDPIPLVGHLDDLVLVPLGILLARRLIPEPVLAECRERARVVMAQGRPVSRTAAVVIVALWVLLATVAAWIVIPLLR